MAGHLPAPIFIFVQMRLLYNDAPLSGTVFYLCQQMTALIGKIFHLIGAVFHNICHRIQLLRNNLPVFQQPVIPGQIQPCFFKNTHTLLYNRIRIRAVLLHLHYDLMIRLSRTLQRFEHVCQIGMHRAFFFAKAERTLTTVYAQTACQFILNPSHLFC